jgi:1-acyl-sn-glycerol-3-phosphate acyltransferase
LLRSAVILFVMAVLALVGVPLQWLSLKLGRPLKRLVPLWFHRTTLALLGVKVTMRGVPATERPLLLVANHASWLDIPVLSSITPLVFVAKSEIAGWPLFGLFAKLQRSVFVDRARRHATAEVNREIANRLASGDPVVLFGEGTSSDGNQVLPFRSALFGAMQEALDAGGRGYVQPVSIAYTHLHGLPMGRQHRAVAAWYGDAELSAHFARVFREGAIDVTVSFGPAHAIGPGTDRKQLTRATETAVRRMTVAALTGKPEIQAPQGLEGEAVPFPAESR